MILFNILALLCIAFIIWWFWLAKAKANSIKENAIDIIVKNGVYEPNRITAKADSSITLNFIRKDLSPCSEFVIFDALDIHVQLPVDKKFPIKLVDLKPGTYKFTCQMGMYQGELVVD
jgi:plastocyanin domain-containing protein